MAPLYRTMALWLFSAAVLISAAMGSFTYFYEMRLVDSAIADHAVSEARTFAAYQSGLFLPPGSGQETITKPEAEVRLKHFLETREANPDGHFIIAEIYGAERTSLAEAAGTSWSGVKEALTVATHRFPDSTAPDYDTVTLDGQLYIRVVVPLFVGPVGATAKRLGYFEGVYHVSEARLASIRKRLISTVLLVIGVVLGTTLFLVPVMIAVGRQLVSLSRQLVSANIETLEVLGNAIAKRDSETGAHNYRVTIFAIRLGETVGLNHIQMRALIKGAFLHDVGKIAISDTILLKPGKLTTDEFTVMKQHVGHGFDIVASAPSLRNASDVVLYHHEKFDGSGYPKGLKSSDIPMTARIFAIADVFDALISSRPYKGSIPFDEALAIITEGAGNHFDPVLVAAFITIARPLYDAFANLADEAMARQTVDELTKRYFTGGPR